jgi:thioesterase domain-containing protein
MAARYLAEVQTVQPEGPYLLGGWSLGAVVAFEMARQLEARGERVALLALIDPPPPQSAPAAEGLGDLALLAGLVEDLEGLSGRHLEIDAAEILALPPGERLARVLALAQSAGALSPELRLAHAEELLAVYAHNRRALDGYVPIPYSGELVVVRAQGSLPAGTGDPTLGWRDLAAGGTGIVVLPGDHYSLLRPPAVEALATALAGPLTRS